MGDWRKGEVGWRGQKMGGGQTGSLEGPDEAADNPGQEEREAISISNSRHKHPEGSEGGPSNGPAASRARRHL